MIKCKIGLIAKPRDDTQDCFLNLGEVFDKTIRGDVNILYEFHKNLRYLCPFKAEIDGRDGRPDNIEEIMAFQSRYKLTRKIWLNGKTENGTIKFLTPQLFDISCMVPLFQDIISRTVYPKGRNFPAKMFILFPYSDPFVRGEIIDSCLTVVKDYKVYFYVMGEKKGMNSMITSDLNRRYLLSCGVEDNNIVRNQYDEFPDCIMEALNMINLLLPYVKMKTLLALKREDMNQVMTHIRMANSLGMIDCKFELICN